MPKKMPGQTNRMERQGPNLDLLCIQQSDAALEE